MYVVTGITGNTGSVVAERLMAAGKKVRGVSRTAGHLEPLVQKGCEAAVADLTNREALAEAFDGAEGVYVMIPPEPAGPDFRLHQRAVIQAVGSALERSKVKNVVALSSVGAEKAEKTGPVVGLHEMEERLNSIAGLNVLHLRAGYFMENTLTQAGIIQAVGSAAGPLLPELKISMIASYDIGVAAAQALIELDFNSHQTRELLGPRDISMEEVATIIGKTIGRPDLKYVHSSQNQVRDVMLKMGMQADLVSLILEMTSAMNTGFMKAMGPRNARNSTPTTYEEFAQKKFLPYYQKTRVAA
ncbi:MAG TPA: NAD(P)H-binding protein [Candidatus Saccharimonadales bacterium]|nr:NAD(P)H-binding protein [Candidatus Saccharimonadales bacterium]